MFKFSLFFLRVQKTLQTYISHQRRGRRLLLNATISGGRSIYHQVQFVNLRRPDTRNLLWYYLLAVKWPANFYSRRYACIITNLLILKYSFILYRDVLQHSSRGVCVYVWRYGETYNGGLVLRSVDAVYKRSDNTWILHLLWVTYFW